MGSKKKGIDYLMEDFIPSGGDPALMMGTGKYSDRYIKASDSAFGSYSNTRTGKADKRYNGTESGTYLPTGDNWRQDRLAEDVSNPYYQEIARKIGINQLSSANDMGQVLEYLENQSKPQVAAAPAAPAPTPEPEKPKPPAFNLGDYTEPPAEGQPNQQGVGFMRQFVQDVNNRSSQSRPAVEAPRPSLYEQFAADYERRQRERRDSFAADATGQAPASDAPAQEQQQQPAGTFAQATGLRQDDRNADRADRIATGGEPESTRFAGGSAFGVRMGRGYEELNRTYDRLSGRRSG